MTPEEIDDDVKKLISIVNPHSEPFYLPVEPESYAEVRQCFPTVEEKIKRDGGSRIIGWQIWKSDLLIEAEFHAVWKSSKGELKDITPKLLPVPAILFLPDPKAIYTGAQVDNIRINISGDELVDDIIEMAEAEFRIKNKGERAFQYEEIDLSKEEDTILETLIMARATTEIMLQQKITKDHPCFCGSLMKYRSCHGNALNNLLKSL